MSRTPAVKKSENPVHELLKSIAKSMVKVYYPERDKDGNPSLSRFFLDNGRFPFIDDEIKPWEYRGWLIPYLQREEGHPMVTPRYDYVSRTLEAGQLLDEPIPHLELYGEHRSELKFGMKMLQGCIDRIESTAGTWNAMRDFCEWLGYALGVTHKPSELKFELQEFLYRNFNIKGLVYYPSDYLGLILCESSHGKKNGFYPTPVDVCKGMAELVMEERDPKLARTMDPAVGTGRLLLVASNFSLRLFGQDIDPLCCLITKINLALYAPWHYIPESFFPPEQPQTANETETDLKTAPALPNEPEKPLIRLSGDNLIVFQTAKMPADPDEPEGQTKYSTNIEDQLDLFR